MSRLAWGTASAQPITIAFWSNHTVTGVYSVAVRNGATNRAYVTTYTHTATGVAQYNTVTIPGDTTGTWNKDNTIGMYVSFAYASGTNYHASGTNIWTASGAVTASTQVNGASSSANFNSILACVVLPGNEAPSAARSPLIMRPYDQELVTCQRYYCRSYPHGIANGTASVGSYITMTAIGRSGTTVAGNLSFPGPMRATPTINIWGYAGTASAWSTMAGVDISSGTITPTSTWGVATGAVTAGQVIGTVLATHFVADARLG